MTRSQIVQAAVVVELVILMLMLLAGGGATRQQQPQPATTYRPATEQERQQYDRELLEREMDRQWPEWQPGVPAR